MKITYMSSALLGIAFRPVLSHRRVQEVQLRHEVATENHLDSAGPQCRAHILGYPREQLPSFTLYPPVVVQLPVRD